MTSSLRTALAALLATLAAGSSLHAAALPNRLSRSSGATTLQALPQGVSPRVKSSTALGRLSGDTRLESMSLDLAPSAAQSAALDQLLADQQNPASPRYHQWLTPEQFGAQFGVSDADLQVLQNWLTNQGFQVVSVAPSRNQITFSGSASTAEAAFHTQFSRFRRNGQQFFENSTAPELPTGLQGVVSAINGLSSYRIRPNLRKAATAQTARPEYTTAGGTHYLTPYDFRQIYNGATLFNSGFTGTGVKIAVVGQSAVDTAQLGYFQQLTGQTVKAPTLVLVPNSGNSTVQEDDEAESEGDLEYTAGVAPGATILFVYTGVSSTSTLNVNDALNYAIVNNVAPILSYSYGSCETENSLASLVAQEAYYRQANAQGQTILAASGDTGAAGCEDPGVTVAYDGLQVDYPASSPYVTGIGGTTLADGSNGSAYWNSSNNSMGGSALGYIPETTWNDNSISPLSAGGGGYSHVFGKPNWQVATGVPADGARDVPDISFSAANQEHAYLICTSDAGFVGATTTGKCTASAFGANGKVGGTSLPTPAFAGALAMMLNANNKPAGLGNLNPILYRLYGTTPSAFHDITSGTNSDPCQSGTLNCVNGAEGYSATTGYDLATGLGSLDLGVFNTNLAAAVTATGTTPTLAITATGATTTAIQVQVRVSSNTASTLPTGSITATLDGGSAQTVALVQSQSFSTPAYGSIATVTFTGTFATGSHTVAVSYTGDANFSASTGSTTLTVSNTNGGLTLSATPTTVTINSSTAHSGSWTLNIGSTNGYTGIVYVADQVGNGQSEPQVGCLIYQGDVGLPANASVPLTVTYSYSSSDCSGANVLKAFGSTRRAVGSKPEGISGTPRTIPLLAIGFTGLLGSAFLRRRRTWMTGLLALAAMAGTAGLSGCGSGSAPLSTTTTGGGTTTVAAPKGTYNFSFIAEDYANSSPSASVNVTLVVQ